MNNDIKTLKEKQQEIVFKKNYKKLLKNNIAIKTRISILNKGFNKEGIYTQKITIFFKEYEKMWRKEMNKNYIYFDLRCKKQRNIKKV